MSTSSSSGGVIYRGSPVYALDCRGLLMTEVHHCPCPSPTEYTDSKPILTPGYQLQILILHRIYTSVWYRFKNQTSWFVWEWLLQFLFLRAWESQLAFSCNPGHVGGDFQVMFTSFSAHFRTISTKQNARSYSLMRVGSEARISFSQRYKHASP